MKKKNNMFFILGIIVIIIAGGFFVFGRNMETDEGSINVDSDGEVQKVVIGMKNFNYYPQEVRVKVNQPVEIYLDESVGGCFRDFTIREFGIRKYLQTPSDKITFTPEKKGTFTFACSMNMGTGRLIVE